MVKRIQFDSLVSICRPSFLIILYSKTINALGTNPQTFVVYGQIWYGWTGLEIWSGGAIENFVAHFKLLVFIGYHQGIGLG